MSKRKWAFKLTDVQRAIKAVKQECLPVSSVRISADGTIIIDTRPAIVSEVVSDAADEWKVAP